MNPKYIDETYPTPFIYGGSKGKVDLAIANDPFFVSHISVDDAKKVITAFSNIIDLVEAFNDAYPDEFAKVFNQMIRS